MIFSPPLQSVGRDRLLRADSTSCLYLSQLSFFRGHRFDIDLGWWSSSSLMRIGRWSELSADSVCQEHDVLIMEVYGNETSRELGSAFYGNLVGLAQLRIP